MSRTTCAVASRLRRKRVLERAKGFRGSRSKLIRQAYGAVNRAMAMAYVGRKQKKNLRRHPPPEKPTTWRPSPSSITKDPTNGKSRQR